MPPSTPYYETDRAVAEYLLFHYGSVEQVMPWAVGPSEGLHFPARCAALAFAHRPLPPNARALDLGCAVGGATHELARHCPTVLGIDFSHRFIETARRLIADGQISFPVAIEGELTELAHAVCPTHPPGHRIDFAVGDALHLPPDVRDFDIVLAANLLDRVPDPRRLLSQFDRLVGPGGTLVITSPYTWMEEYTPRERWLTAHGGRSRDRLSDFLPAFDLVQRLDLPFVIREHARKYQWSVAEATVWLRAR